MNLVGSVLGVHIHDAARRAAVFRAKVVGNDAELLNRIGRYRLAGNVAEDAYVFHAVQKDFGAGFSLPVDGIAHAITRKTLADGSDRIGGAAVAGDVAVADVTGEGHKIVRIAIQARELRHLGRIHQLRKLL